jgi:transcriptional regulator with XRE-family HTH domain
MGRTKNETIINYQKGFGERLKVIRTHYGLRQNEFAERVESAQSSIARLEMGERVPTGYIIKKIIEQFDCDAVWLVTGKGDSGLE